MSNGDQYDRPAKAGVCMSIFSHLSCCLRDLLWRLGVRYPQQWMAKLGVWSTTSPAIVSLALIPALLHCFAAMIEVLLLHCILPALSSNPAYQNYFFEPQAQP